MNMNKETHMHTFDWASQSRIPFLSFLLDKVIFPKLKRESPHKVGLASWTFHLSVSSSTVYRLFCGVTVNPILSHRGQLEQEMSACCATCSDPLAHTAVFSPFTVNPLSIQPINLNDISISGIVDVLDSIRWSIE